MKPKKILLVTSFFPYGNGESFIKAELEHIADCFDGIEIVPCFHSPAMARKQITQDVDLDYSSTRWGFFRGYHVVASLINALRRYRWRADALRILQSSERMVNLKELARALYRAQLFEKFLEKKILKDGDEVSLIYFYWMIPEIVGAAAFRRHSRLPIKVVCRAHGGDLYEDRRAGGYAGLRDSIVTGVDKIYCISDHGKSYLTAKYPLLAKKIQTARLGVVDPGFLNVAPRGGALAIVSCSFLVYEKRVHLIVDAIACLLENDPALTIRWTHIGNGPLFDKVRAYAARKLPDPGRVEVNFTGYLPQAQVMNLYRETGFDVFVNVSDAEGLPVSLMEASSAGMPMVATNVGGSNEIVNAANGVLLDADPSVDDIAAALLIFHHRAVAGVYRQRARSYWAKNYHAQVNYNKFGHDLACLVDHPANAGCFLK